MSFRRNITLAICGVLVCGQHLALGQSQSNSTRRIEGQTTTVQTVEAEPNGAKTPRRLQVPPNATRVNRTENGLATAAQSTVDPNGPQVNAKAIDGNTPGDFLPPLVGSQPLLDNSEEFVGETDILTEQEIALESGAPTFPNETPSFPAGTDNRTSELTSGQDKKPPAVDSAPILPFNGPADTAKSQTTKSLPTDKIEHSILAGKKEEAKTELTAPAQIAAPAQVTAPAQIPAPTQNAAPAQIPAPTQITAPVRSAAPAETASPPTESTTDREPVASEETEESIAPAKNYKPTNTSATPAETVNNSSDASADMQIRKSIVPILSLETVGPSQFVPDQVVTFKMIVRNLGETTASDVIVNATLPTALQLVTPGDASGKQSKQLSLNAGTIAPNAQKEFTLKVKSSQRGTLEIGTDITFTTSGNVGFEIVQPELAIESSGPATIKYGEQNDFVLRVTNTGDGTATNVKVTSQLPRGFVSTTGEEFVSEIGSLQQGETREVKVQLMAESVGNSEVKFEVTADHDLGATAVKSVIVLRPAVVAEVQGPDLVYLDREGLYAITVSNPSKLSVTDVQVKLSIPEGLQVTSIDQEAAFNADERTLLWKLDRLDAGKTHTFQLKATATIEGRQVQSVAVTAAEGVTNEVAHDTMVISRPDVSIVISDNSKPIKVGESTDFIVTLTNKGTKSAGDVKLEIQLSDGLRALDSPSYGVDGTKVIYESFDMDADQIVNLKFTVTGIAAGDHVVRASITHDQSNRKLSAEESVFYYDPVQKRVASQNR